MGLGAGRAPCRPRAALQMRRPAWAPAWALVVAIFGGPPNERRLRRRPGKLNAGQARGPAQAPGRGNESFAAAGFATG